MRCSLPLRLALPQLHRLASTMRRRFSLSADTRLAARLALSLALGLNCGLPLGVHAMDAAASPKALVSASAASNSGSPSSASALASPAASGARALPCRIEVVEQVDEKTRAGGASVLGRGWPVPLVELRTTHQLRFVSDNAGLIALDAPELMGREVWFSVIGHGYEVAKDGFGYAGLRLRPEPGKTLRVEVQRRFAARRVGRLTGSGLFAESQKLGERLTWRDQGIHGCDSVQTAVHRGRMFWAWGDTTMPQYPLGLFDMSSATTAIRPLQSLQPPLALEFDYVADAQGRPRSVAKMPGKGPTWLSGYVSLPDREGRERLVASYVKIEPPMEAYETGLCVWDDEAARFELLRVLWRKSNAQPKAPPMPDGHPLRWRDAQGKEWLLFGNPLPTLRCPANFEAWQDAGTWELLKPPPSLQGTGGEKVQLHSGSMAWNAHRHRWVTVFMEKFGRPSVFGELWYAEAAQPLGPWGKAVKVLSHDNQTFYNPRLHPEFTPEGSALLYFEGTYTKEFAQHAAPTPRYDYNQMLYCLDLDDPALNGARTTP